MLNTIQIDAITELLNIGIGSAASALSEMVDDEVALSIPEIALVNPEQATKALSKTLQTTISAVHQEFQGPIWGKALLFFPEKQSLDLVRAVIDNSMPLEDVSEVEQEAIEEIGNVILNACLSSLADVFGKEIHTQLPEFYKGDVATLFQTNAIADDSDPSLLLLKVGFSLQEKDIKGYVSFFMSIGSLYAFLDAINAYMGSDVV